MSIHSSASLTDIEYDVDDFMQISLATLVPGQLVAMRLFTSDHGGKQFRLYKSEDFPFSEKDRQALQDRGKHNLWIRKTDHTIYQEYLRENLSMTLADETIPVIARAASLSEVVRDVMLTTFRQRKTDAIVSQSVQLADDCVSILSRDDLMAHELVGVLHHDYHTFTHSTNVAFYAVTLANALGLSDQVDLSQIAVGGFVHDLGKLDIPERLLTKPRRLTDEEFEIIREHPKSAFRKLCKQSDISHGQLMMAYQHHERLDGKGYPVGCVERDLHLWSKICSVVDVFEALTSNRPYRKAVPRREVYEMMQRESGLAFDKEILECWISTTKKK